MYSNEPDAYGTNIEHNDTIDAGTIHKQLASFRGFVGSGKANPNP
jgi:hypothetical protein